eukprot:1161585-Pelagomonas_calceolata.AAC.24
MGQKLSCGRLCMPVLPGTQKWLASPQTAIPTPPSNNKTMHLAPIMEARIGLLHVCFHTPHGQHPCACGTDSESCTQPPPSNSENGANRWVHIGSEEPSWHEALRLPQKELFLSDR